jgi:TRAP transporter TAXI family solute receptor
MVDSVNRRGALKTGVAAGAALIAGCSSNGGSNQHELRVVTAAEETSGYQMSQALAAVVNERVDNLRIDARPADGAQQGMFRLNAGDADIAYTHTNMAKQIVNEEGEFAEQPFDINIRGLFHAYSVQSGLAAKMDSGIRTVNDLTDKRVAPNPPGSAIRAPLLRHIGHAINVDDMEIVGLGFSEEVSALSEGRVDVISDLRVNGSIMPGYVQEQYSVHDDLWLLHWPDDIVESIKEDPIATGNYFSASDMEGPRYGDRSEEWWVDTLYNFYTSESTNQEAINLLMNAIWDHADAMVEYHPFTENWQDMDYLTTGLDIDVPLHAGAQTFYGEQDVDI